MTVQSLDHVNIRVPDPEATKAFFTKILGMGISPERSSWITDASGHPAVHLGDLDGPYGTDEWRPFTATHGSGVVHHVALNCTDYDAMIGRLTQYNVEHVAHDLPQFALRQLFVEAPGGVMLELNFRG